MSKDEFYYDFARRELERQDSLNSDYQERAYRIITVAVALLGATAVTLNLGRGVESFSVPLIALLAVLSLSFVGAMFRSIQILGPKPWSAGVEPNEMRKQLPDYEERGLREWAADHILDSVASNDKQLSVRAGYLKQGLAALAVEGLCVVLVGVFIALNSGPNVALPVSGQA